LIWINGARMPAGQACFMSSALLPEPTEFRDPRAVDTWDSAFRWRRDGILCDVTIEDTWTRVARALTHDPVRETAYRNAFARWQLLPDARVLRFAGTGEPMPSSGRLGVVLNSSAFVARRTFDHAAFESAVVLAKALVEDARALQSRDGAAPAAAVAVIGFAQACQALGLTPASSEARELAAQLETAIAHRLGSEAVDRTPQPLLARFANCVSEAFDEPESRLVQAATRMPPQT
jgi:ribonucleoside-diphosphate reductase alpha chain